MGRRRGRKRGVRLTAHVLLIAGLAWMDAAAVGAQAIIPETEVDVAPVEEPTSSVDEEARGLFLAGRAAYEGGRFEEALRHFERAYELSGRTGLLYNIGTAADRLRRDEQAIRAYEQYLLESPDTDIRENIEARMRILQEANDDRAELETEEALPPVDPSVAEPVPPVERSGPAPRVEPPPSSQVVPWLVAGAGAIVAATGAALLLVGSSAKGNVEDAPAGTVWTDVEGDYDSAATLSTVGAVLLTAGVVGAAAGVTWLVLGGVEQEDESMELRVGPAGVVLRGTL